MIVFRILCFLYVALVFVFVFFLASCDTEQARLYRAESDKRCDSLAKQLNEMKSPVRIKAVRRWDNVYDSVLLVDSAGKTLAIGGCQLGELLGQMKVGEVVR